MFKCNIDMPHSTNLHAVCVLCAQVHGSLCMYAVGVMVMRTGAWIPMNNSVSEWKKNKRLAMFSHHEADPGVSAMSRARVG